MRPLEETSERWRKTFLGKTDLGALRAAVRSTPEANPCLVGLRSVCWKAFLLFETLDTSRWRKQLEDSRSAYNALKEHFTKDLNNPNDLTADDPSSDGASSPWATLQQDEELRVEIFQDVERCMPENSYFREPPTQSILLNVLFIYCKLNRDISYRQGMHEVLAPLVWVIYCDAVACEGEAVQSSDDVVRLCLDASYIEHDAFTLFSKVMQSVKTSYETGANAEKPIAGVQSFSPIVERSKRIHENFLHSADPELAEHLTAIEVLPQIFLIRWIRLIFGREFHFEDVLTLWDVLFAEDPALELIDLISVSMLLRVRWQLLEEDYTGALTLLLRYPSPTAPFGPPSFVSDALYLRDNLHLDGGDHIISKYSNKSPETTVSRKLPRRVKRARTAEQEEAQHAGAPALSPARKVREQVGIDGIIQDAAKRFYDTGEKWGVSKALSSAVQGLQATSTPSGRSSRRSLDSEALLRKVQRIEERNVALSRMLARGLDELWTTQKEKSSPDGGASDGTKALSLAIAKLQFVQVYLENPAMELPSDLKANAEGQEVQTKEGAWTEPDKDGAGKDPSSAVDGQVDEKPLPVRRKPKRTRSPKTQANASIAGPQPPATPPNQTHKLRPSLSESPYSWMLGDEQPKSGFVSSALAGSARKDRGNQSPRLFSGESSVADQDDVFTGHKGK